jgi:hypothetical protein
MIDIQQFMNATYNEANSTKREANPVGEYPMKIDEVELETFPGVKDPTKTYLKLKLRLEILDPGVKAQLGRDKVVQFDDWLLDLTDGGGLDFGKGKNVRLGKVRDAVGQNVAGVPWAFPMLKGQVLKGKIEHEMYQGDPQSKVVAYTKV